MTLSRTVSRQPMARTGMGRRLWSSPWPSWTTPGLGGTLLNQKLLPQLLADDVGVEKLSYLVKAYFQMDGHHIQFNVVDSKTLVEAQSNPEKHSDLIVRVAGYSDYFVDIGRELQDEIIARTEQKSL